MSTIKEYHAHVYYDAATRPQAEALCQARVPGAGACGVLFFFGEARAPIDGVRHLGGLWIATDMLFEELPRFIVAAEAARPA